MKPVVPKIRVGDVLRGTKNLRRYLRTCSLVRYFRVLASPHSTSTARERAKGLLYTPGKADSFVVAVNNYGRFCVWGSNADVVLLFANREGPTLSFEAKRPVLMDGNVFAQWFIRTNGRHPDMTTWPKYSFYLWAALQMNAWRNPKQGIPIQYSFNDIEAPFEAGRHLVPSSVDIATIKQGVHESLVFGTFRNMPDNRQSTPTLFGGAPMGPTLDTLEGLRQELKILTRDPRVLSRAKTDDGLDLAAELTI